MPAVRSLGIFVGTGECNARCAHCAGVPFRKDAPKKDGDIDEALILKTLKDCHARGARSLTLSSSGEPTLSPESVTKVLMLARRANLYFDKINLYTNGIRIGTDEEFCDTYLAYWNVLGLTDIHMTVHDARAEENAKVYGVKEYPSIGLTISRMKNAGLKVRANVVLTKDNCSEFNLHGLFNCLYYLYHIDGITLWSVRDPNTDVIDTKRAPSHNQLDQVAKFSAGYIAGNLADGYPSPNIVVYTEWDHDLYDRGEKLTLFPNGVLSNTWCS